MKYEAINFTKAVVLKSVKYQKYGVLSPMQEVVFQLRDKTQQELAMVLDEVQVPLYEGQELMLIDVDDVVIAYYESNSNEIIYLVRKLNSVLYEGLQKKVMIVCLLLMVGAWMLLKQYHLFAKFGALVWLLPALAWYGYKCHNYFVTKKLSNAILDQWDFVI